MNEALPILREYLAAMPDAAKAAQLFAPDAVLEFPYFASVGLPDRFEGRDAIAGLLHKVVLDFEDFRFQNIRLFPAEDVDRAFAEYEVDVVVRANGRRYHQLYGAQVVVRDGRITLLREFTDTLAISRALFAE